MISYIHAYIAKRLNSISYVTAKPGSIKQTGRVNDTPYGTVDDRFDCVEATVDLRGLEAVRASR